MSLGQPEFASFSDDGMRSEPSSGSLAQELEYIERSEARRGAASDDGGEDEGPRTPRIGPALDDEDGAREAVTTVDLTTTPRRREKRVIRKARASRIHAVTPPAGPEAVAPLTFCAFGDFAAPIAGSPARSVRSGSTDTATPTRATTVGTPGTPESPGDEDPRAFRRSPPPIALHTVSASSSSEDDSARKLADEESLVERHLGCSVGASLDADAASDSDASEPPTPPLPRSPVSNLDLWLIRRGLGKYLDAIAALGARRVSDLVFVQSEDLDALGMTPDERAAIRIHVAC